MKKTEFDVKFHFGVRPVKKRDLYVTALFLCLAVRLVSRFTKAKPMDLWAIIDEIGRRYRVRVINEIILRVPELLSARIDREIEKAFKDAKIVKDPSIDEPTWIDEKEGETPLGGTLGYTYDFFDKDNEQN